MVRNLLLARDTDSAKEFIAQGDKFLFGPSETKAGKYPVAVALDSDEQYDPVFVTGARTSYLESLHTDDKPHILFLHSVVGGDSKLVAANLGHKLWERDFTSAQMVGFRYQLDQHRNVLLTYKDSGVLKYAYLDGDDGSTVGEFAVSDMQTVELLTGVTDFIEVDRESILPGYDFAKANDGTTVGGYLYQAGPQWISVPGGTPSTPDYITFRPGMWATTPGFFGVGTTDPRPYFMVSNGWMKLGAEIFRWTKTRTADGEYHAAAVQYAIIALEGAAPSLVITYQKVVKAERTTVSGSHSYTFTLVSETGNRITSYIPLDSTSDDKPVVNIVSGLGEVWLYGNTDGADYRNYHKFANDATFIESVTAPISVSDTHEASFTDESRYLLVGPTHATYDTMYDPDGVDVTPSIGGSDTIVNCYVLNTEEYVQASPGTPDTGSHTTYHHLWEPSGSSLVAKVIALSGSAGVWVHPASVDTDYGGAYLSNGLGLGKTYDASTKKLFKVDDLAAGSSVIYFTADITITDGGDDYEMDGWRTRRPAWIEPGGP